MNIRSANVKDIKKLVALENRCFDYFQMSAPSFRHLMSKGNCDLFVVDDHESQSLIGYVMLFYRKNSKKARLYSIAIDGHKRGINLGKQLMELAEQKSQEKNCSSIILEVRAENTHAIRFYKRLGYVETSVLPRYYDDGMDAIKMAKILTTH